MHVFILAGGFATRLWPIEEPKALFPIAGKPLLTHTIEQLPTDAHIFVSTNEPSQRIFERWERTLPRKITLLIESARNDSEKLGALGALASAIASEQIDDDLLIITGDNYFGFSFQEFLASARNDVPLLAAYDIRDPQRARSFGTIILDADGRTVRGFEEKPLEPHSTLVSTGCSWIPRKYVQMIGAVAAERPDNLGCLFEEFLRSGVPVDCWTFTAPWFDIGSFHAYLMAAEAVMGDGKWIAATASVDAASRCEGTVIIGEHCTVTGSTLKNVVLFEGCTIENCMLSNCVIDNHCVLKNVDLDDKVIMAKSKLG